MPLSSTSAVIEAANSKLAIFLRTKEEEEALLRSLKIKPTKSHREGSTPAVSRWASPPDFRAPSPLVDRPQTASGATSFHFAYDTISKTSVPIGSNGEPISGSMGASQRPVCDYAKYIERDGAAEISAPGQAHAAYIERPGASEWRESAADKDGTELPLLGPLERVEGKESIFTNISDHPDERLEFWRAVEARESNPRVHMIFLKPTASPGWWEALPATDLLDEDFKEHALRVAEQHKRFIDRQAQEPDNEEKFKVEPFICSAEKAGKLIEQAEAMPGLDRAAHPLWFKSGRGGHIQYRMVAELPHEIPPEARAEIVGEFCDHIATLEEREDADGEVKKVGMMYTAVIHAPDPHNDSRNFHLHVVAHDRPATIIVDENGQREWDFAATIEYVTPRRQRRSRYKYPVAKKIRKVNGRDFIPNLRKIFAQITNKVLRKHGIKRQVDPRTFKEMKIDRTPTKHLGNKSAALASIGVPTSVGQANAISIWTDAERAITKQVGFFSDRAASEQDGLQVIGQLASQMDPDGPETHQFFQLLGSRQNLIERITLTRSRLMTFDLNEAKAKSGAIRTIRTCEAYLAEIEAGSADPATKACRHQIENRLRSARSHIDRIDAALAPHRAKLKMAADALEADEQKYEQVTSELRGRTPRLRAIISHGAPLRSTEHVVLSSSETKPEPTPAAEVLLPESGHAIVIPAAFPSSVVPAYPEPPTMEGQRIVEPIVKAPPAPLEGIALELGRPAAEPGDSPAQEQRMSAAPEADTQLGPVVPDAARHPEPAPPPGGNATAARASDEREAGDVLEDHQESSVSSVTRSEILQQREVEIPGGPPASGRPTNGASKGLEGERKPEVEGSTWPSLHKPSDAEPAAEATIHAATTETAGPAGPIERNDKAGAGAIGSETTRKNAARRPLADEPAAANEAPDPGRATPTSRQLAWELIFRRIKAEKLLIQRNPSNGNFSVAGLSDKENEILGRPGLSRRSQGRLKGYFDVQEKEVGRVLAWLRTHGPNPGMLILMGREARLSEEAGMYIRKLFHGWGGHPRIREALSAEEVRRRGQSVQPKAASSDVAGIAIGQLSGTPVSPPGSTDATGSGSSYSDKELRDLQDQLDFLKATLGR